MCGDNRMARRKLELRLELEPEIRSDEDEIERLARRLYARLILLEISSIAHVKMREARRDADQPLPTRTRNAGKSRIISRFRCCVPAPRPRAGPTPRFSKWLGLPAVTPIRGRSVPAAHGRAVERYGAVGPRPPERHELHGLGSALGAETAVLPGAACVTFRTTSDLTRPDDIGARQWG